MFSINKYYVLNNKHKNTAALYFSVSKSFIYVFNAVELMSKTAIFSNMYKNNYYHNNVLYVIRNIVNFSAKQNII